MEQEKREQERQASTSGMASGDLQANPSTAQNLLSDHEFERLRADVLGTTAQQPQGLPAQGLLPLQQQPSAASQIVGQHNSATLRQKFLSRGINQQQWRHTTPSLHQQLTNPSNNANTLSPGLNYEGGQMIRKEGYVF